MVVSISLNFTDRDLKFFREAIRKSRNTVRGGDETEIIGAVRDVLTTIRSEQPLPDFVALRLPELDTLIAMLEDRAWRLPKAYREYVLATFVYFGDPEDIIPDHLPAIGFVDDLILIELLLRNLRHVREAYADFCRYRERQGSKSDPAARRKSLEAKRKILHERMRRRQAREKRPTLW